DGAAVDVEPFPGNAELVAAVDDLHGERLVEFPDADVLDLEAGLLEQLRHSKYGADAHLVGLATDDLETAVNAERLQAALLRFLVVHNVDFRSIVRKRADDAGSGEGCARECG